ncbi:HPr family phosphocarrier protein [Bacillus sonorensis]|nr:HPr family phosphocarrier protein [Bacillus sonorensis]
MVQQKVEIRLKTGLQARPAALFVQEANRFQSDIFLEKGDKKVNAKSIMGLMSLAVSSGSEVTLIADGADEQDALEVLTAYVQEKAKPLGVWLFIFNVKGDS